MPNTNTRWYRLITSVPGQAGSSYIEHVKEHLETIPNILSYSFLPTLAGDGGNFVSIITTMIMNGSKVNDDAAMFDLANHLLTMHGYTGLVITVVTSDTVYP
jgi:hypothetical protein